MRRLFLRDCQPGDVVEDVFIVTGKQLSTSNSGKYFIKAFISDRSCQVTARMWNATRDIFGAMPESGFLRVRGHIENYQNNLQFIVEQLWPAKEGTFEINDLMPHTSKNIEQMCRRLTEMVQSIQNRHLAAIVQAYLDDEALMGNFCKAPAAMSFHHAFIGGLLEHTLNAIEIADAVCRFYPGLNRDLVVAGIFLHDIAKTWELCYDCAFGYTDAGHLVGHIVKSAIWIEQRAKQAEQALGEKIPRNLIDVLQHIVLSHHGHLDNGFGSARNPQTPEAMMVHMIDDMDAKMMLALQATRGDGAATLGDGNWTEYIKSLGGRLYRPDVAPADAPVGEAIEEAQGPRLVETNGEGSPKPEPPPLPTLKLTITNPLFETASKPKNN